MSFLLALMLGISTNAAQENITYFACTVKEGKTNVSVKFAIKDFDPYDDKNRGELVTYPGADEDFGLILVSPTEVDGRYTKMSNLNGQGGDLRITSGGDLFLFGDGDGYQYTDLVIWSDGNEDRNYTEGYVRDYGSAYGSDEETFKQFIKCKSSTKVL
jgi:hypothetical protein